MEMLVILWQWIYEILVRMATILPFVLILCGLYLFFRRSKDQKRIGAETIITSILLGGVILLSALSSQAYGTGFWWQSMLFYIYYTVVIVWIVRIAYMMRTRS